MPPPSRNAQRSASGATKTEAQERARPAAAKPSFGRLAGLCVAAWLVPGLGHWRLKKRWRAVILFVAIVAMFIFGLLMQGTFFSISSQSILERLGFFSELSVGLPMMLAKFFGYGGGNPFFTSADYGTAYLVSAGMLNVLALLDAFDIAVGRKS